MLEAGRQVEIGQIYRATRRDDPTRTTLMRVAAFTIHYNRRLGLTGLDAVFVGVKPDGERPRYFIDRMAVDVAQVIAGSKGRLALDLVEGVV